MAFATYSDLEARLGVTLTSTQQSQATAALEAASTLVAAELDVVEEDITDVPAIVKQVTITAGLRLYSNPQGLANESERLGEHQHSRGYSSGALELTYTERLLLRRAYWGATSGSSRPESTSDEVWDYLYS